FSAASHPASATLLPYTTLFRSGRVEPVVKRSQHQADRPVVDVAELVAAHRHERRACVGAGAAADAGQRISKDRIVEHLLAAVVEDRKSTRLNSSHEWSSYAVFC